jgi:hypothetical protein
VGKHHSRGKTAVVVVALAFVGVQVTTGAISNAVDDVWSAGKDEVSKASAVQFDVETDRTKLNVAPSEWTAPQGTELPAFPEGSCETIDAAAQQMAGALATSPVIRLTMIGQSTGSQVIVRNIYPEVVKTVEMPPFVRLSCPIGGPLAVTTAEISFQKPQKTTYRDEELRQIAHFEYALEDGEPGVVYVQRYAEVGEKGLVSWDLMVEYSVDGEDYTVNVNHETGLESFRTSNSCGAVDSFEWLGDWLSTGPALCSL